MTAYNQARQAIILHKRIIRYLVLLVILSMLVGIALSTIPIVARTGAPLLVVVGDSMEPTFKAFDLLIVTGEDVNSLKVGDVIAYRLEHFHGEIIVHRIVQVNQEGELMSFITQGDNNPNIDDFPAVEGFIDGKILLAIPVIGILFSPPANYVLTIVLVIFVFISLSSRDNSAKREEENR